MKEEKEKEEAIEDFDLEKEAAQLSPNDIEGIKNHFDRIIARQIMKLKRDMSYK